MVEITKRRGKLLAVIGFLLFGITVLVGSLIVATYTTTEYLSSIPFIIDSFLMVLVSPGLIIVGVIMYLYGTIKGQRSRPSETVSPAPNPADKPVEKTESDKGFTTYQKVSLAVSIISIVISILLRLLVK